ncbi:MAG: threonine/serine dehydratase [Ignavibacteria bacterium]|nr:threonine/serine dehydratase [Ignavibacteria bacterium]
MTDLPTIADIHQAAERIASVVHNTPVHTCRTFDLSTGCRAYFKCENFQKVGAFKARGASNAVLSLGNEVTSVATHSSGNHGAAVAYAARLSGKNAQIVIPEGSNRLKVEAIRQYGGIIRPCAPGMRSRQSSLADVVRETGAAVIHPFDDSLVIAGQGTAALELLGDLPDIDLIVTPVGGGGLISGTLLVAKSQNRPVRVIGVEPATADDARQSFRSGTRVTIDAAKTIADGLRASIGERNFELIRTYADDIVTVTDEEIVTAMRFVLTRMKILIEPSAAAPVAALLNGRIADHGKKIGIILTGGNADPDDLPW